MSNQISNAGYQGAPLSDVDALLRERDKLQARIKALEAALRDLSKYERGRK